MTVKRNIEWMQDAACKGLPLETFFPESINRWVDLRPSVCSSCPVKDECLEYSVSGPVIEAGYWGGLSTTERLELRRERARQ